MTEANNDIDIECNMNGYNVIVFHGIPNYKQKHDVKLSKKLPSIDFHIHTNWTDGKNSVKQVYKRSNSVGLDYMLYSEHSRKSSKGWFFIINYWELGHHALTLSIIK